MDLVFVHVTGHFYTQRMKLALLLVYCQARPGIISRDIKIAVSGVNAKNISYPILSNWGTLRFLIPCYVYMYPWYRSLRFSQLSPYLISK